MSKTVFRMCLRSIYNIMHRCFNRVSTISIFQKILIVETRLKAFSEDIYKVFFDEKILQILSSMNDATSDSFLGILSMLLLYFYALNCL